MHNLIYLFYLCLWGTVVSFSYLLIADKLIFFGALLLVVGDRIASLAMNKSYNKELLSRFRNPLKGDK